MILSAVTDRHRLGAADDRAAARALIVQARAAADAGLDFFQIREPDLPDAVLLEIAARAREAATGSALRILINDRVDIATAAGADGVHLRGTSFAAARVRTIVPAPFVIGRSVHGVDEATAVEAAGGLDYLLLGAMFPTRSKPAGHRPVGVETLAAAVHACRLPVLAIGGIDLENAPLVARAGAAGLAAIGLFLDPHRLPETAARLRQIFAEIRPPA